MASPKQSETCGSHTALSSGTKSEIWLHPCGISFNEVLERVLCAYWRFARFELFAHSSRFYSSSWTHENWKPIEDSVSLIGYSEGVRLPIKSKKHTVSVRWVPKACVAKFQSTIWRWLPCLAFRSKGMCPKLVVSANQAFWDESLRWPMNRCTGCPKMARTNLSPP